MRSRRSDPAVRTLHSTAAFVRAGAAIAESPASATVGTVEPRSLIEPLRKILARVKGHYLQASAVDIDMTERLIEVQGLNGVRQRPSATLNAQDENFYVP